MDWSKQLMAPFTYGSRVSEERWEMAFGKRKDGMNEEPPPKEDVYQRKVREYIERHESKDVGNENKDEEK